MRRQRESKVEQPRLPPGRYAPFGERLRDHAGRLVAVAMSRYIDRGHGILVVSATALEPRSYLSLGNVHRYPKFSQLAREAARYRPQSEALVLALDSKHAVLFKVTKTRNAVHVDLLGGGAVRACLELSLDAARPVTRSSSVPADAARQSAIDSARMPLFAGCITPPAGDGSAPSSSIASPPAPTATPPASWRPRPTCTTDASRTTRSSSSIPPGSAPSANAVTRFERSAVSSLSSTLGAPRKRPARAGPANRLAGPFSVMRVADGR
jgi:hypothetical protein